MNNPILHSMAERFVERLVQQLESLEYAFEDENVAEMSLICNWLKGEAYTLGFHDFTHPVAELENLIKEKAWSRIPARIVELKHMASRIVVEGPPTPAPAEAPVPASRPEMSRLRYTLPANNAKKAELMENFVAQLGTQLLEMESAVGRGKMRDLQRMVKWILKYAGAFNFNEILEAAENIDAAVQGDTATVSAKVADLSALYSTLELVR